MNKKDIILFVTIFCILGLVVSGTYAYWQWETASEKHTTVEFNTTIDIEDYFYYDGGESHFVGNFQPSNNHCGGKETALEFYVYDDAPRQILEKDSSGKGILSATIKLDINKISSKISSSNYVKWAVTAGSKDDCGITTLSNGTFNGKSTGDKLTLLSSREIFEQSACSSTNLCKYTVWVWLDNAGGSELSDLSGETIDVKIWTEINMSSAD